MIPFPRTDVLDTRWPGPCWRLGCCWSPPPAVAREQTEDVTRCRICNEPVSMTETAYVLRDAVTHAECGAPMIMAAEILSWEIAEGEVRS